jgi:hypothetical protein
MVMTLGFLALGPFAIGYITVALAEADRPRPIWGWCVAPWVGVVLSAVLVSLLNLEGTICVAFALPIALALSSVGGLSAGVVARMLSRHYRTPMACVAILPLILAPAENRWIEAPIEHRIVQTQIHIHAPASMVWANIERVRTISPMELRPVWTHRIGFPRPVEATLSHEGVGGIRHASFEHGLVFIETITVWDPNHLLGFSIQADTTAIPSTTLDDHVTVGGRYFDVLNGEYRIEDGGSGDIVLHLSSEERLSTDFNGYAGFWSDAVMRSLQNSILEVLKTRCERSQAGPA